MGQKRSELLSISRNKSHPFENVRAHILNAGAGEQFVELFSRKVVEDGKSQRLAKKKFPVAGEQVVVEPAIKLRHSSVHHHAELCTLAYDQPHLGNLCGLPDERSL